MMLRLKDKILHPWPHVDKDKPVNLPAVIPPRPVGFPASIAEFLLVMRLRLRRRSAPSIGLMERAAQVLLVTCKSWFGGLGKSKRGPRKP